MTRVTKDPEIRAQEILDVAEQLMNEKGYRETSVSDIVKKVGVAQGTFYYYFSSKEEVLETLIKRNVTRIFIDSEQVINIVSMNAKQKFEVMVKKAFKSVSEGKLTNEDLYHEDYLHIMDKINRQNEKIFAPLLMKLVEEGIQEGCFKVLHSAETVDFIIKIFGCLSEFLYKKYTSEEITYRVEIAKKLFETALGLDEGTLEFRV
jgi:AcrR family transcriptional regulator